MNMVHRCKYTQIKALRLKVFLTTELMKLLDIEKTRTVAFKPSSDGLVERYNQTIVDIVQKISREAPQRWDKVVSKAVLAYNGMLHSRTGFTPNKLWLGREVYHKQI